MAKTGRPPGFKATKLQAEAGSANLKKWQDEGGLVGLNVTHGCKSKMVRKKYGDKRTTEGKRLAEILRTLVEDLGGPANLTAGQQLICAGLRGKIIVLLQMGSYLDGLDSVIDKSTGELSSGFLKHDYLSYCEGCARDIERLYKLAGKRKGSQIPSIDDLISANKENEK